MALTAPEKLSIAKIIGVTPTLLDAQIISLGSDLNADREAAIREELTRWTASGASFVKVHPTESNYGVETNAGDPKLDIQRNLALLLEFVQLSFGATMGTLQLG
jgi:hypothetical protein